MSIFWQLTRWVWINTYENTIFSGLFTSINPSYFDVNRRGTIGFDTLPRYRSCLKIWLRGTPKDHQNIPCFPNISWAIILGPSPSRSSIDLSKLAHMLKKSEKQIQPWPKQIINHLYNVGKMLLSPYGSLWPIIIQNVISHRSSNQQPAAYHRLVLLLQLLDEVVCTCRLSRLLHLRLLRYFSCCAGMFLLFNKG